MSLPSGRSYWADRTSGSRRRSFPVFRGQRTADAVVIGGGLTGCAAAYAIAAAGFDVVLLEAGRLAGGGTSAGLGAIVPEPDARFRAAEGVSGRRLARAAWKIAHRSALELASALRRVGGRAEAAPAAFVLNARDAQVAAELRREQAARRAAGLEAPLLTAKAARAELGTDSVGALRSPDGFAYDPVRAALGFALAADRAGAKLFERSPVRRTRFTRKFADVVLATGSIRTTLVLVATGEPGALFGQLRRHVRRTESVAVVTEPLDAEMRRQTGRRASVIEELGASPRWLRWLPEDRALFAGGGFAPAAVRQSAKLLGPRAAELMYELSVRYPVISGLPAAWSWTLPVVSTPDGLPWIGLHRNYPFHFFALGFGWHGDALAWFAAKAAVRHLRGEAKKDDDTFGFARYI
jgi:gamma-glutamylputrescine oxidase